jgi:putative tryptophan/tyrosine transport system substrate-binding protein
MRRRDFIRVIAGAVTTWPIAARAQRRMPVIGYLSGWSPGDAPEYLTYFRRGLAETGYTEGRNVAFEFRFAEGHFERIPELVTI